MPLRNTYEDQRRAEAYATLEFPGTYYLAYRDLPEIIASHVSGNRAIDFGCGAGRSTRFLKRLGFDTIGVHISAEMLARATAQDRNGDYRLLGTEKLRQVGIGLSCFTFDNVPERDEKVRIFTVLGELIGENGRMINLVCSPETCVHEWASFSMKDFSENRTAKSGAIVRVVMTDVEDQRPVEDVLFPEEDYRKVYAESSLEAIAVRRPLGRPDEPYAWVNETTIAPWTIYVLTRSQGPVH